MCDKCSCDKKDLLIEELLERISFYKQELARINFPVSMNKPADCTETRVTRDAENEKTYATLDSFADIERKLKQQETIGC